MMRTPRKTVRAPFTLPPSIESAIANEIDTPPRKRGRSPSLSPPPLSPPPSPSSTSSLSSPSQSSASPSPPPTMLPPRKRFKMTSPHPDTTTEAIILARLHRKLAARRWTWVQPRIRTWRDKDGSPNIFEIREISSIAPILPVTSEPIQHIIPLLMARLVHHEDHINEM
ncbi:hypothetical protein Tco_1090946 [Tanacetum coccineum]|uniref:Uncharacterized protein n=1 Tax=Tanacetum coccineum TaxID=301880 RepID=A0ABQ5I5S4_9ASTR